MLNLFTVCSAAALSSLLGASSTRSATTTSDLATPAPDAPAPDMIDQVVEATMAADELPSLALVVARGGTILKEAAYGLADVEQKIPATTKTLYPIASATKSMTSTAVLLLVREGKFSLEDSITELLPDLPDAWLEVTPRHLLTHTSGLPDVALQPGREPLIANTRAEVLAKLRTMPMAAPVGTRWSYNQTNYMLLLMLVEKYGGRPFQTFVREREFDPLGLRATVYGDSDDVIPGCATMYERRDGALAHRERHFPEFMRGAAGVNTSVEDWYRWADAWAHGRILPRADLELQWTPAELVSGAKVSLNPTTSYGCGVMLGTSPGHRSAGHSGGGNAAFRYYIDEDLLVVFATNGKTQEDAFVERVASAAREMGAGKGDEKH